MDIECKVYSNIDKADPTDMPATISASGEVVPGPSLRRSLLFVHKYRLVFDDNGFPNPSEPRNDWVSLQTSQGHELHAPTEMNVIAAGYAVNREADPGGSGNPAVGSEFLTTPTPAPTINASAGDRRAAGDRPCRPRGLWH